MISEAAYFEYGSIFEKNSEVVGQAQNVAVDSKASIDNGVVGVKTVLKSKTGSGRESIGVHGRISHEVVSPANG